MDSFACECKDCALANASDCESVMRRLISGKNVYHERKSRVIRSTSEVRGLKAIEKAKNFDFSMEIKYNISEETNLRIITIERSGADGDLYI